MYSETELEAGFVQGILVNPRATKGVVVTVLCISHLLHME